MNNKTQFKETLANTKSFIFTYMDEYHCLNSKKSVEDPSYFIKTFQLTTQALDYF